MTLGFLGQCIKVYFMTAFLNFILWQLFWILCQVNCIASFHEGLFLVVYLVPLLGTSSTDFSFSLTLCVNAYALDKAGTSSSLQRLAFCRRRHPEISPVRDSVHPHQLFWSRQLWFWSGHSVESQGSEL